MKYLACILGGFILGSSALWAGFSEGQSSLNDFGSIPDIQQRQQMQQWWIEKELRNGRNPYQSSPCPH